MAAVGSIFSERYETYGTKVHPKLLEIDEHRPTALYYSCQKIVYSHEYGLDLDVVEQEADINVRRGIVKSEASPRTPTADHVQIRTLLVDRRAMQANLDTFMRLVEQSHTPVVENARVSSHGELKRTKFSEATDVIEAYLPSVSRPHTRTKTCLTNSNFANPPA